MNVKDLSLKRLFVVFVLIIAIVMAATACRKSRGGDGGVTPPPDDDVIPPPPQPPIVFSSPEEAATSGAAVRNAMDLMDTEFGAAMLIAEGARPSGFAAGLGETGGGDISAINPTLAMMVEKMGAMASSPVIQKAVGQAGALRARRVNSFSNVSLSADYCIAGGSAALSGTNNYDDVNSTTLISEYVITFAACRDSILLTELDGSISIEMDESINTNAVVMDVTAVLTEKRFADLAFTTVTEQTHLDGSFRNNDQVTSGSKSANGKFILTTPAQGEAPEATTTLSYTGLDEARTQVHNADQSDTETVLSTGDFKVTEASGGVTSSEFSITLSLTEMTQTMNDQAGTRKNWLDGTVETKWSPDLTQSGCLSGTMEIDTVDNAPLTFTSATGFACPASGSIKINNSATTYGATVNVGVDGVGTLDYADCAALAAAGGVCGF